MSSREAKEFLFAASLGLTVLFSLASCFQHIAPPEPRQEQLDGGPTDFCQTTMLMTVEERRVLCGPRQVHP